jgi:peptide/nickel transport system substrate-binding protein
MNMKMADFRRRMAGWVFAAGTMVILAGCAPKVEDGGAGAGSSGSTRKTNTSESSGTAADATGTSGTAASGNDETTLTIEHRAAAAPPFKLPYPDALPAEHITPGKRGGNFTFCEFGEGPKTLNPITGNDSASNDASGLMFSGLISYDPVRQTYDPGLLKEWYMEDDKHNWILKLRDGLKWSDGHPITADDIVFTSQVIYDPNILNAIKDILQVAGKPVKFEKVDNLTVRATVAVPTASFQAFMLWGPVPRHVCEQPWKEGKFSQLMNTNADPASFVCSGPFKFKQFVAGQRVVLERNPNYFRYDANGTQLPYLDTFVFTYAPNQDAMVLRFKSAEVDGIVRLPIASIPDLQDAQKKGNFTVANAGPGMSSDLLWFNLKEGINTTTTHPYVEPAKGKMFRDARFRRAALHAIDRNSIIKTELRGQADIGQTIDSPANKVWYNRNLKTVEYDQAKAKALLDEMDLKDRNGDGIREDAQGNKVSFSIITNKGNQRRERCVTLIAQDLHAVGIDARPEFIDFNALLGKIDETYEYEACLLGLGGGAPNPANNMNALLSSARTNLYNPKQEKPATPWNEELDKLCLSFNATLELAQQKKTYDRILEIYAEELPVLPLWFPRVYVAYSNKFDNVKPSIISPEIIWNADEIFVK